MNGGLIPNRYAKALYKFALDNNQTKLVYEEMQNVVNAFEANAEFQKVLANPFVSNEDKAKLLLSAAGENPGDAYKGFVKLILDNKREEFAYEMALAYRDIYRKANNIAVVKITTAAVLPEAENAKLRKLISDSFPDYKLEFTSKIDKDIIGGFVIDVDSTRLDASISNEIEQIRLTLLSSN